MCPCLFCLGISCEQRHLCQPDVTVWVVHTCLFPHLTIYIIALLLLSSWSISLTSNDPTMQDTLNACLQWEKLLICYTPCVLINTIKTVMQLLPYYDGVTKGLVEWIAGWWRHTYHCHHIFNSLQSAQQRKGRENSIFIACTQARSQGFRSIRTTLAKKQ